MIRGRWSSVRLTRRGYIDSVFDDTESFPKVEMVWTRVPQPKVKVRTKTFSMTGHGLTLFTRKQCAMYDKDVWTNTKRMWHMPSYVQGVTRINPFQLVVFGKHSYWLSRVLNTYIYFCDLDKQTCVPLHEAGRGGKKLPEAVSRMPYSQFVVAPLLSGTSLFVFGTPPNPKSFLVPPTGVAVFDVAKREPIRELPASELKGPAPPAGSFHACYWDELTRKFFLHGWQYVITFDPATLTFGEPIPIAQTARFRSSGTTTFIRDANNTPYLVTMGGVRGTDFMQVHVPDVDLFDLSTQTWKVGKFADDSPFPLPRREPTSCAISPHSIAFGGGRTHYFDQNDVWILSFKDGKK
jgi:hypothetical protein